MLFRSPAQDPVETVILNDGVDVNNPAPLTNGNDIAPTNTIIKGDDQKNKTSNVEGTNKADGILNSDAEQDRSKTISGSDNFDTPQKKVMNVVPKTSSSDKMVNNSGSDNGNEEEVARQSTTTKTTDFIIEPNRTITTIKISDGKKSEIYRKVFYNWGGLYYFKNLSYSITQNLFELGTGEK